ncbi:MAG: DUF6020 family protein [Collinsella sp.]
MHTAIIGSCVQLGLSLFNSANAGLAIYTCAQFVITAACMAYSISSLRKLGVSLPVRGVILLFFVFMPMFSNYAACLPKTCSLPTRSWCCWYRPSSSWHVACPVVMPMSSERARKPVLFARHDWLLLVLGALGSTFLRNGGLVFPLAACVIAAAFCAWDAHTAHRAAKQDSAAPTLCVPRLRWVGILAVLALCLVSNMYFTKVFMPAHDITPGSKREVLSIPFQQTARFVQKHDGLNSGVNPTVKEDGTIVEAPCDGLVTDEERAVIDRVLKYENLGRRYNPISRRRQNCFNEYASQRTSRPILGMGPDVQKDPECYISALINNYYGYFYPSARDAWVYSTARSAEIMAKPDNLKYFDFHPVDSKVVRWCDHLINLYRVAVQRIPFISLTMSSATYVWIMIAVVVYLLRRHSWRGLAIGAAAGRARRVPDWPCNGSTYMRYLYPVIACMPLPSAPPSPAATSSGPNLVHWGQVSLHQRGHHHDAFILGFISQARRYIITTFVYIARASALGFRSKPIGDTYVRTL